MLTLVLAFTLELLVAGRQDPQAATSSSSQKQEIERWITQLGDDDYFKRVEAFKQLEQLRLDAEPSLQAAKDHADFEIRQRARQLLKKLAETSAARWELEKRLKVFAADASGKDKVSFPGWERSRRILADSPATRALFVQMQLAEQELLAVYARTPQDVIPLFKERADLLKAVTASPESRNWPGTVAATLLIATDKRVKLPQEQHNQLYHLVNDVAFDEAITGLYKAPLQKLLTLWLARPMSSDNALMDALSRLPLAQKYGLKAEALTIATDLHKALGSPPQQDQIFFHTFLLATLGQFGDRTHIELVEPYLENALVFGEKSDLRDLALAVLINISGKMPKDYGLRQLDFNSGSAPLLAEISKGLFENEEQRSKAIKKWQAESP